jgi:hypothetical protein
MVQIRIPQTFATTWKLYPTVTRLYSGISCLCLLFNFLNLLESQQVYASSLNISRLRDDNFALLAGIITPPAVANNLLNIIVFFSTSLPYL